MISVIIPTYNEEDVILECLESLFKQSIKDFEIIVVDDGSTDTTLLKLRGAGKTLKYKLRVIRGKHQGAGAARNLGTKSTKGDILVFVDADMKFDQNFIQNLTLPIINGKSRGTFSKDEYVSNWDNTWAKCWNINEGWENKKRHPKNYPNSQKVFRAILKSEFDRVGGFTPGGYNDDWSLSEKLGYEATVVSEAVFYHKNPDSLKEIYNQAKWVGKRRYKLYVLGYMVALIRSSLLMSLITGTLRSTIYLLPTYLIFKIVYDFGVCVGIIKYMFTKKGAK